MLHASRLRRQTLVPAIGLLATVALAGLVTAGAARRPESAVREAARAYAGALAAGDARAAAEHRADRDPGPEQPRAEALRGVHWAVREVRLAESRDEARVTILWVGREGRQQEERQLWALDERGVWTFVGLGR